MRAFFFINNKKGIKLMKITPFAARGPLRIIGYIFETVYLNVSTYVYYWHLDNYENPDARLNTYPALWYRKPCLADRGPFAVIGEVVGHKLLPYVECCFRYTEDWWQKTGQLNSRIEFGLALTPWIYYSRNISTTATCL
jgi:hypothetical protein